ncbi:hypothetical protein [Aeromonas veronii]|uniref:hypothetical protein n=1 Tax=Aeromonas veronii TaxID=654 RepID=UPI002444D897|nr:hypothetical protein [Aeromonas veronii]
MEKSSQALAKPQVVSLEMGGEDEDQHKAADDHERQRGNEAVTDGQNIALLAQFSCQWADLLFDQLDQHPIE